MEADEEKSLDINSLEVKTVQVLTFKLAGEEYGISISEVQEVIRPTETKITPIPRAPKGVEGIINLRGKIIPVVDLRKKLALRGESSEDRIIVASLDGRAIGLLVDDVLEVARIPLAKLEAVPELAFGVDTRYVKNLGRVGEKLVVILDLTALLAEEGRGGEAHG